VCTNCNIFLFLIAAKYISSALITDLPLPVPATINALSFFDKNFLVCFIASSWYGLNFIIITFT
jgi:hypothetical protein